MMIPSALLPLLLLTSWSVSASPTSTTKSSVLEHEATATQVNDTTGNQPVPGLSTGVTDANLLSPSPSPNANEADGTESPAASSAEPTETPSTTSNVSDNSDLLDHPESAILGGASKISDAGHQAAQTASAAADQTSESPTSTPDPKGSGDPLGDLSKYLNGAGGLLSPSLLPDLEEVVHDAAYLLKAPTTKNTKILLGSAFDLLNPDSVDKITSTIHTAQDIITPEVVDELKKVHLVEVFDDIGYFWNKGKSVLSIANGLVSEHLIQNIEDIIESVKKFLSGGSIEDILNKLEGVLPPELTNSLKVVLSSVGPFVDKAKPIFGRIENYLSHADYNRLQDVGNNVGDLIGAVATVVTPENIKKVEGFADNAKPYAQKVFDYLSHANWDRLGDLVNKVEGLISAITSALSPESIKKIENLADNAKPYVEKVLDYLSHANWDRLGDLVNNVENLIGTVATAVTPEVIKKIESLADNAKPYFEKVFDYLSHANWDRLGDLTNNIEDLISAIASALSPETIKKIESIAANAKPYAEKVFDYLSHANWDRVSDLVNNAEDFIGAVASFVTPERIQKGEDAFNNAKGYFSQDTMNKARDLGRSVWFKLTPEGINRVSDLLGNAEALLGAAAPLVTPDSLDYGKDQYSKAKSYLPPDFMARVKDASSKLGILYNSITPGITTPNLDKLGGLVHTVIGLLTPGFANETSSLIGTASGVLTPHLVSQLDDFVRSAEKMFTPDVRNDTKNAIGSAAHVRSSPCDLFHCLYGQLTHLVFQIMPRISSFIQAL